MLYMNCHDKIIAMKRKKQQEARRALEGARVEHSATADTAGGARKSRERVQAPEIDAQGNMEVTQDLVWPEWVRVHPCLPTDIGFLGK